MTIRGRQLSNTTTVVIGGRNAEVVSVDDRAVQVRLPDLPPGPGPLPSPVVRRGRGHQRRSRPCASPQRSPTLSRTKPRASACFGWTVPLRRGVSTRMARSTRTDGAVQTWGTRAQRLGLASDLSLALPRRLQAFCLCPSCRHAGRSGCWVQGTACRPPFRWSSAPTAARSTSS